MQATTIPEGQNWPRVKTSHHTSISLYGFGILKDVIIISYSLKYSQYCIIRRLGAGIKRVMKLDYQVFNFTSCLSSGEIERIFECHLMHCWYPLLLISKTCMMVWIFVRILAPYHHRQYQLINNLTQIVMYEIHARWMCIMIESHHFLCPSHYSVTDLIRPWTQNYQNKGGIYVNRNSTKLFTI